MRTSITLNYKKIAKQIAEIDNLSGENKWIFSYDNELDQLYFSPKKIDKKFSLFSLNDEFSLYVDKDSNIGGIFIEYYRTNLASHENKFKLFANIFTQKNDTIKTIPEKQKSKALLLSEVLKAEILADLVTSKEEIFTIPA